MEESNGHCLGRQDLFRQLRILTKHKVSVLQEAEAKLAATGEELPDMEQKALAFCQKRLAAWQIPRSRDKAAAKLLKQTGFRERQTNRRTSLSVAEETAYLHKSL